MCWVQRLKTQVLTQQELQNANTDVPQILVLLLNTCHTVSMILFALMIQLFSCNHKQYGWCKAGEQPCENPPTPKRPVEGSIWDRNQLVMAQKFLATMNCYKRMPALLRTGASLGLFCASSYWLRWILLTPLIAFLMIFDDISCIPALKLVDQAVVWQCIHW